MPLIDAIFRYRRWVLGVIALGFVGAILGVSGLQANFSPQLLFESGSSDYVDLDRITDTFGHDDTVLIVLVESPELFSHANVYYMRELHDDLGEVEGVKAIDDLTTMYVVRERSLFPTPLIPEENLDPVEVAKVAKSSPLIVDRMVSKNGRSALMFVHIDGAYGPFERLSKVVHTCDEILEKSDKPEGVKVGSTGIPVVRVAIIERMIGENFIFFPALTLIFVVILWILFRGLWDIVIPLSAVVVSVVFTAGIMGATGESINVLNYILPMIILVIGISDAIHLMTRYHQERPLHETKQAALHSTLHHLMVACLLTSVTTAIGFASLFVANLSILQRFGAYAAAGILVSYLITVLFLPIIYSYVKPKKLSVRVSVDRPNRVSNWVASLTTKHRFAFMFLGALILGLSAWLASGVRVESKLHESLSPDDPIMIANNSLERDFNGVVPLSLIADWSESAMPTPGQLEYIAELGDFMDGLDDIGGSMSVADFVKEYNYAVNFGNPERRTIPESQDSCNSAITNIQQAMKTQGREGALGRLYQPDTKTLRVLSLAKDTGTTKMKEIATTIRERLESDSARQEGLGLSVRLTGVGPVASKAIDLLIRSLLESLFLAFGVIFVVMCLLLRSIKAGLISMVPNVLPMITTYAFLGIIGEELRPVSVVAFTIGFGLAVDDTIHFMVRFREEWKQSKDDSMDSYRAAIQRTLAGTGKAIVLTTIFLGVGFSVLFMSEIPDTRVFVFCIEVIVISALVGDLIILPACIAVFKPFHTERQSDKK